MEELSETAAGAALLGGAVLLVAGVGLARRPAAWLPRAGAVAAAVALASLVACGVLVRLDPPGLRLVLDPSTEPLLPPGDPERAAYARAVSEFGDDELLAIAMETDDAFAREHLLALERVHRAIARLPGVRAVQSLADTVSFRYVPEEDWVEVGRLFDAVPERAEELAALRERALADPLLRRTAVSPDGRTAGLSVRLAEMTDRELVASHLDERIGEILAAAEGPARRFHVAGRPHAKASVYRGMLRDLRVLIPLAVAVLAAVLVLASGTRRGVVLPLGSVLLATLWTHAAMAVLGEPITLLSSMLAPQLIAIGSVYGVHLLARYEEERSGPGSAAELSARTLAHVRLPVAISGVTTQIGFGALCLSEVPAVIQLGAFSVLGTGCITFLTLVGLPAALALLPPRRERPALPGALARASTRFGAALDRALARLAARSARHPHAVLGASLAAAGLALWALPRIVVDTDYLSFFDEGAPVRREFDAVNRLLAGAIPIYVVVDGGTPGALREPAALRALERLQARVDALPGVSRTISVADTLRAAHRALEHDDPAAARIPDDRAGVAELLQLVPKDELARLLTVDASRANLVVRTGAVGSAEVRRLAAALRAAIREELPPGLAAAPVANAILLARSADGIARSQARTVGAAALAILALVTVALRSLRLGVIALLPNVFPVLLFFGLLGLGAAPLSLPTSLIGAAALGVAIDDTVHFLVRYRRARASRTPAEAAREAGLHVGRPIAVTSLVLAAGFGVIALSSFATLRAFGLLFAATVGICVVSDLLLLPALLVRLRA